MKKKNLDCIIKAFKSRNINQDFKLVVAGYGHKAKKINKNIYILWKNFRKAKSLFI